MTQRRWTYERFMEDMPKVHGELCDYTHVKPEDIKNADSRFNVKCTVCQYMWNTTVRTHYYGSGRCPSCAGRVLWNPDYFIFRAKQIHKDKYKYGLVYAIEFSGQTTKVPISCRTCGYKWSIRMPTLRWQCTMDNGTIYISR